MSINANWTRFGLTIAAGALAVFTGACTTTVTPPAADVSIGADVPAVAVTAPVNVETYPSYVYRGERVYLVNGHWIAHRRGEWVRYREEPRELARHREEIHVRTEYGYRR